MTNRWKSALSRLRDRLVENWPIKITALGLAAIVWAAVAAEEPTTQLVPVRLDVTPPEERSIVASLPEVQALVQGTAREIIKLYADPPTITVVLPDTISGATYQLALSVGDIDGLEGAAVTVQQIEPRTVTIVLDELTRREVPVVHRVTIVPDSGYVLIDRPRVTPRSLTIEGPQSQIALVDTVFTVPLRLTAVTSAQRRRVAIDTTGLGSVRPAERYVTVSATVEGVVDRVFDAVRVAIVGPNTAAWTTDPVAVAVTARGMQSRITGLARDSIQARVRLPATADDSVVAVDIAPLEDVELRATPDSVVLRRTDRD
jgi:YbbR domain-containing protein